MTRKPLSPLQVLLFPFGTLGLVAVGVLVLGLTVFVLAPLIAVALLAYAALPYYQEFFPHLSPRRRALLYAAAIVAVFGPLAGAFFAWNPGAEWHPAFAARLAVVISTASFALGAAGILMGGFWRLEQYRMIEALPTARAASAARGLVELKGRARAAEPGKPILDVPFRFAPPVFLPGFWLEDESGRIWIEPGEIPVRYRSPRAFGFRVNDIVLTRNARAKRGLPSRLALLDGDRVYLVGWLTQQRDPEYRLQTRSVVTVAPAAEARDYRHMFFLSDSSEDAALRQVAGGVRRTWMLGWIWVAAALAIMLHAVPRAIPVYDSWSFTEVVKFAPRDQLVDILVARWHSKTAEQAQIASAIAANVAPPGSEGVFEILVDAIERFPGERANMYAGMGKLTGYTAKVFPFLIDGLKVTEARMEAADAIYSLSGTQGYDKPRAKALLDSFAMHPDDDCAALKEFSSRWWALNIGATLAVELFRRCGGNAGEEAAFLMAERAFVIAATDAPDMMRSIGVEGRRAMLRSLHYRTKAKPELARAVAGWAYDADPDTAALAGAIAAHAGIALAATAESKLFAALTQGDTYVKRAAIRALRKVPALSGEAFNALAAAATDEKNPDSRDALVTLASHEPEPGRATLLRQLEIGHAYSVRAKYLAAMNTGVAAGALPAGFSLGREIKTVHDVRQLATLWQSDERTVKFVQRQLMSALLSPDPKVREEAARHMGQRRQFTEAGLKALARALHDEEPRVRRWAADSLLKLRQPPESIRDDLARAAARSDSDGETLRAVLRRYDEPYEAGAPMLPIEVE